MGFLKVGFWFEVIVVEEEELRELPAGAN